MSRSSSEGAATQKLSSIGQARLFFCNSKLSYYFINYSGEMAEWFKAAVLKTAVWVTAPWVRIPLSPPASTGEIRWFSSFPRFCRQSLYVILYARKCEFCMRKPTPKDGIQLSFSGSGLMPCPCLSFSAPINPAIRAHCGALHEYRKARSSPCRTPCSSAYSQNSSTACLGECQFDMHMQYLDPSIIPLQ